MDGKSKEEAKRIAQYSATTSTSTIEKSPQIKAAFARLVRRSIPAHKLAQRLAEGVDATKSIVVTSGKESSISEVVDFRERREYVKLAAEFGGYVEKDKAGDVNVAAQGFTLINLITKPKG